MSAPTITGLTAVSFTEGSSALVVDQGLTIAGGSGFAGGAVRIDVASGNAGDQLSLKNAANGDASGAITVDAGVVYLGNGSGRDAIGTIDSVENGLNGAALKINLGVDTGVVTNPSFETDLSGWIIGEDRVILGQTVLNGWTTPNDPTTPPMAGNDAGGITSMTYTAVRATDQQTAGDASLRLFNSGGVVDGYDVVHGPYAISNTFNATQGEVFKFDWRAAAGGDAYDAFGYLMNAADGTFQILVNETGADDSGQKPWTTESVVIPNDGQYFFVFVAGTYDFTGGKAVGGSLYVDNLRNLTSDVDDAALKAITAALTYASTSDSPVSGARNLTLAITDSAGASNSAMSTVTLTNVNDAPTGGLALAGTRDVGGTLTATSTIADADGLGAITYQWQRGGGSSWTDLAGETGTTYVLSEQDVGVGVRLLARYTDGQGAAETVASASVNLPAPPPPPAPVFTEGSNTSIGTAAADTMSGLGGDDQIRGGFGNDVLQGNQGQDSLFGNEGEDTMHGGQDSDIVRGGQDNDVVFGDAGDDVVFGDLGADRVDGGDGNDVLWGGQGAISSANDRGDILFGGAGSDYANGNAGDDTIDGGEGQDTVQGGRGDDVVLGGAGDDVVMGDFGNDTLSGGAGADRFNMQGGGNDRITDFNFAEGDRILLEPGATYTTTQSGADLMVTWAQGQITLANVNVASLGGGWIVA